MTRKGLAIVTALLVAAMFAAALALAAALPAEVRLPIHWGITGAPDRFAGKWTALLMPAGLTAGVGLLFWFLPALEPRKQGLARSQGLYLWGWASVLLVCAAVEIALAATALGWNLAVDDLLACTIGLMLAMIGNQLGKSRSMYMVGIRTPWTLASEEVWIKTHRLGGKLMIAAGAVMIAVGLLPLPPRGTAVAVVAAISVAAVIPIVYSWLLWRREQRADQPRG
jgi:uncharacterized membrane protein